MQMRQGQRPLSVRRFLLLGACFVGAAGCREAWRPPLESVQIATTAVTADLLPRMAPPGSVYVYLRTFPMDEGAEPVEYRVYNGYSIRREGDLARADVETLDGFLLPGGPEPDETAFAWPDPDGQPAVGFFLDFDPPLTACPRIASGGASTSYQSKLRCYSAKGRHIYNGDVARRITFEGYETITVGGIPYTDCVRLRRETQYHFPWIARVDVTEYLWLAPGMGEIKRLQRWRGFVLLSYFETAVQDELLRQEQKIGEPVAKRNEQNLPVQDQSRHDRSGHGRPKRDERWQRCAVYLSPPLPKPILKGLIIEMADRADSSR